jgi:hypothetical protein
MSDELQGNQSTNPTKYIFAKLYCSKGIFWEYEFATEAEARACVMGALALLDEIKVLNDDSMGAKVDYKPTPRFEVVGESIP